MSGSAKGLKSAALNERAAGYTLLNYPGTFEPLPEAWNSSKTNRLPDDWAKTPMGSQASKEYIDALRDRQQAFEAFAKNLIEFWTQQ